MKKLKKKSNFKPDRKYINLAMNEFLEKGGKIKKIFPIWNQTGIKDNKSEYADHFLMGE